VGFPWASHGLPGSPHEASPGTPFFFQVPGGRGRP
jgi:hypothetical protein